ncbi:hypothetical protein MJO28_012140 [Puccinia striiformis f. sp. tritici]|uniref:Hydrophobin n=2 Tax=Puccinia striiformis TaxID=27350 RepID=A0A2S4W0R8_9BASI|nr:hypothetical protein MJO28_012140 [Puccinia striiformis f. sp. tritici]POW15360.1 hypothetical protein PSTT_02172 [Puccinia striiformis]
MHYFKSIAALMAVTCGVVQAWQEYNLITLDCVNKHKPYTIALCGEMTDVKYFNVKPANVLEVNGYSAFDCHNLGNFAYKFCCDPGRVSLPITKIDPDILDSKACLQIAQDKV